MSLKRECRHRHGPMMFGWLDFRRMGGIGASTRNVVTLGSDCHGYAGRVLVGHPRCQPLFTL